MDDHVAWTGRRVLVTGAAGFIGSRLATRLASAGARVTGFDRVRRDFLAANVRFRQGELGDPEAAGAAVAEAEVIFHLAAANGHRQSMEEPRADFEDNVMGTVSLLAAVAKRAPRARVVFASTRQLYGRAERLPAGEDHRVAPPDVHAVHKETAEHLVRHSAEARDVRFSVLRLTNTYGPGQPTTGPAAGLTGRFLGDALAGREITILGSSGLLRDFNYVDDVADAFLRAGLRRKHRPESGIWGLHRFASGSSRRRSFGPSARNRACASRPFPRATMRSRSAISTRIGRRSATTSAGSRKPPWIAGWPRRCGPCASGPHEDSFSAPRGRR